MPKGYTSRAKIEDYLLITIDPTFYTRVDGWIADVEDYIDRQTGRNFIADSAFTERQFDGSGNCKLMIDDCVAAQDIELAIGDSETVDPDDLVKYPANFLIKKVPCTRLELLGGIFPRGQQNITVSGKWGFSVACPGDIELAATVLAAGIINYAFSSDGEVQSETIGRYSVTYKDDKQWSDFERIPAVLKSYRKYSM